MLSTPNPIIYNTVVTEKLLHCISQQLKTINSFPEILTHLSYNSGYYE